MSLKNDTCIAYGLADLCAITSSGLVVAHVDKHIGIPLEAAALEVPVSPSSWASRCAAAGANPKGMDTLVLKISVVESTSETSRKIRGRNLYLPNAFSLSFKLETKGIRQRTQFGCRMGAYLTMSPAPSLK